MAKKTRDVDLYAQFLGLERTLEDDILDLMEEYVKDTADSVIGEVIQDRGGVNQMEIFGRDNAIVSWSYFKEMMENNSDYSTKYKTLDGKLWNKMNKIETDTLFVHINISARTCMKRIANIMNRFYISPNSITIQLK